MTVIWIASLIALALVGASFLALRKLTHPQVSSEDLNAWIDTNWQASSPIERLLDPSDFEFLRKRGLSAGRIKRLRATRRSLFRIYMRRLTHEFNMAHNTLQAALLTANIDRPDLVAELGRQRFLFYRGLIAIEMNLTLNALGFDSVPVPSLKLIRPLERLHMEFCNLVPDLTGALA